MGVLQANVSLWQILARQGEISQGKQEDSWRETIRPFAQVSSSSELFDAGRNSLLKLLRSATGEQISQNKIIELIAGPRQTDPEGQRIHRELADRIRAQAWADAYVFLKHEVRGPEFAETLSALFGGHP